MSEPFLAEIRIVAFNFSPPGWAYCNGQVLAISQNTALFSLLGTYYGGNGQSTFALPNLQGLAPLQAGQGPGLSNYFLGQSAGVTTVTLMSSEMPAHTHFAMANTTGTPVATPINNTWAPPGAGRGLFAYNPDLGTAQVMDSFALAGAGGGTPHNNMPPYLTLNFIIALEGIYPLQ